uniref:Uncharacterized protein n=2 Tax=Oryza sativa subsp. japonica TaxID=39947 RepID=A0A5S6RD10_ORYSJ|nr:hypothetical protein [Oryza sativa Japonica Group]AAP54243.1 hypothetical protein LOC_Os10g33410 [Oryza sativa Japonica Group]
MAVYIFFRCLVAGQKWDRTARRRIFPQMQPPKARASRASDQRRVASPLSKSENDGDAAAEGGDSRWFVLAGEFRRAPQADGGRRWNRVGVSASGDMQQKPAVAKG